MFRKNQRHLQPALISNVNDLPVKLRQRLETSWAGTFRQQFCSRLKEEAFAVLYSAVDSRPNVPVNVLVSLDTLKGGFGWSDEELYDKFCYDLQVRYAVGYDNLGDGQFELRTLYNFRRRVSEYNQAHSTNLLQVAFVDITDQQITAFKVHTGQQRMDSTQIASNMLDMSRLQLLVEAVQPLTAAAYSRRAGPNTPHYWRLTWPAVRGTTSTESKADAATDAHLLAVGQVLYRLLTELAQPYGQEPVYQVLQRLFADNFRLAAEGVQPKANAEIGAGCLQSLDDQEASYRRKDDQDYKGYVANLSETCDPANPLQLITHVQVAPNNVDDAVRLCEAVPELKARMPLDTLYADGGYGSSEADEVLLHHRVTLTQSGLRGKAPAADRLSLADHAIEQDETGRPVRLTCAGGQRVPVVSGRSTGFVAYFDPEQCAACPFHTTSQCRAYPGKRDHRFRLLFTQQEVFWAQRRRRCRSLLRDGPNPRAAVEATVRSVKHPFPAGQVPVRGRFRVLGLLIASAAMTNIRRLQRYRAAQAGTPGREPGWRSQRLSDWAWVSGRPARLSTLAASRSGYLAFRQHASVVNVHLFSRESRMNTDSAYSVLSVSIRVNRTCGGCRCP